MSRAALAPSTEASRVYRAGRSRRPFRRRCSVARPSPLATGKPNERRLPASPATLRVRVPAGRAGPLRTTASSIDSFVWYATRPSGSWIASGASSPAGAAPETRIRARIAIIARRMGISFRSTRHPSVGGTLGIGWKIRPTWYDARVKGYAGLPVLLLAGCCSTFDRDFDAAKAPSEATAPPLRAWAGTWHSDPSGHAGGLRCIISRTDSGY